MLGRAKSSKPAADGNRDNSTPLSDVGRQQLIIARCGLALVALFLILRGLRQRGRPWLIESPLWDLQYSHRLKALILGLGMAGVAELIAYMLVGFLAVQCIRPRGVSKKVQWQTLLQALAIGIGVSALVSTATAGPGLPVPNLLDLVLPSVGCLFGAWIGVSWAAGGRSRIWVVPKLVLLGTAGAIAMAVLLLLAIEPNPLAFEPAEIHSDERVRLTKLIHSKSPRTIPDGQTVTLTLTKRDIDLLLSWGLSLGSPDRKARIELAESGATLQASIRLPIGGPSNQYLNLTASGQVEIKDNVLHLDVTRFRVGRLSVPRPLLWMLSPGLTAKIRSDPRTSSMLAEVHRIEITDGAVSATYGRIDMPDGFRNHIFGSVGPDQEVYEALTTQFEQITELGKALPPSPERFGAFLQAAFRIAHDRSAMGDPVVENRAAVIALGISLGHGLIGEFVGTIPHDKIPPGSLGLTQKVSLRERVDWSRHFLVGAALAVISTDTLSHDVGVLKEELDAGTPGGSGFSFADLAAERSGTMFSTIATRDAISALAIQQRLCEGFAVDDYFPPADDLPENIPQQRIVSEYGGVGGKEYESLLKEIDERIATCAAYQ